MALVPTSVTKDAQGRILEQTYSVNLLQENYPYDASQTKTIVEKDYNADGEIDEILYTIEWFDLQGARLANWTSRRSRNSLGYGSTNKAALELSGLTELIEELRPIEIDQMISQ